MLKIGIVGFGFMGRMHYRCWKALEGARIVAVCDPCAGALRATGKGVGNIAGADGEVDLSDIAVYTDPEDLLARERPCVIVRHKHAVPAPPARGDIVRQTIQQALSHVDILRGQAVPEAACALNAAKGHAAVPVIGDRYPHLDTPPRLGGLRLRTAAPLCKT